MVKTWQEYTIEEKVEHLSNVTDVHTERLDALDTATFGGVPGRVIDDNPPGPAFGPLKAQLENLAKFDGSQPPAVLAPMIATIGSLITGAVLNSETPLDIPGWAKTVLKTMGEHTGTDDAAAMVAIGRTSGIRHEVRDIHGDKVGQAVTTALQFVRNTGDALGGAGAPAPRPEPDTDGTGQPSVPGGA